MSIFGKLLGEVLDSTIDIVDLSSGVVSDVVKAPVRGMDKLCSVESEGFLEDSLESLERILKD